MAAGRATLDLLQPGAYERLEALSARLEAGLHAAAAGAGATVTINRVGSMITVFFCAVPWPTTPRPRPATRGLRPLLPRACSKRGVYLPPAQFEAAFVSLAHTEDDIDATASAAAAFREAVTPA